MGCCASSEDKSSSKRIESKLKQEEEREKQVRKLLLLGTGGAGKSTILKSLKKSHGSDIVDAMTGFDHIVKAARGNMISSMIKLLQKSQELYDSDHDAHSECRVDINDPQIVEHVQLRNLNVIHINIHCYICNTTYRIM